MRLFINLLLGYLIKLNKMRFYPAWINWIMCCVKTISFAFNVNGEKRVCALPQKGIRQEDLLSLYHFILCAEGFSRLIENSVHDRKISGVKISRRGPAVSHLFLAYDTLIFCKASLQEAK